MYGASVFCEEVPTEDEVEDEVADNATAHAQSSALDFKVDVDDANSFDATAVDADCVGDDATSDGRGLDTAIVIMMIMPMVDDYTLDVDGENENATGYTPKIYLGPSEGS